MATCNPNLYIYYFLKQPRRGNTHEVQIVRDVQIVSSYQLATCNPNLYIYYFLKQPRRGNTHEVQITPHKRSAVWGKEQTTNKHNMKKLLLLFAFAGIISLLSAQEMVTIHQNGHEVQVSTTRAVGNFPAEDIEFWVGTGSNSAVVIIGWDDNPSGNDFALAWGVHWNGSASAVNMLDTIATYDSRVAYAISSGFVTSIGYNDGTLVSGSSANYWCYTVNGGYADAYSIQPMADGDVMEISSSCYFSLNSATAATDPNGGTSTDPVDASLPFSQILYWVGSGSNSAEFIVNFAQPDTAFAWGYRFDGTTTAQAMVDAIAAADPRFWTVGTPSYNGDIHFILDNGDTLGLSPIDPAVGYNFWWANLNGVSAGSGSSETLHNGDVFKYGDMNSAIGWDFQYGYYMEEAWTKVPTPVPAPAAPVVPDTFCTTVHPLTYSEDFSSYTSDQSMRPYFASAPIPECWTVLGNGTVHHVGTGSSTDADYFGGVGYSTSTNSFGAVTANDAFFNFIASQIYTGSNTNYINDMLTTGTRRYAVLPAFDAPLSQTMLTFDHRTNIADTNTHLAVGYIVNDTADFVALETYAADNKVLHHDTIRFSEYANVPADARLALMWDVASTTASATGPGNRYCGIDNLTVVLDVADTTPVTPVPEEATIAASDILFWVGEGTNEAVMAVNWADTALAWGYRWNGTATVADMMAHIAAADPRFSYVLGSYGIDDINYIDTAAGMTAPLGVTPGSYWESKNNGVTDAGMTQTLANGDLEKWAEPAAGVVVDSIYYDGWGWSYTYVYPMTIYPVTVPDTTTTPVNPDPEDATISADAITYWVGTGNTEVIFVGNWCSPEVALAWGVRFDGTTTTVEAVMDTLAAYDSRFGYSGSGGILNDVTYQDANYSLTMTQPSTGFIMYNVNGTLANFGYTDMYVSQGDLIKVGNTDCATMTGDPSDWMTMGYAWQTPIVPVSAPAGPIGPTPEEATIDFSEILYWVGTGSNEAVMAVNWADTALAWGYRWNGTATVADMMAHIAAADPRFSYVLGSYGIDDINYIDTAAGMTAPLGVTPGSYWESKNNGVTDAGMTQTLANGDLEKWAEPAAGVVVDSIYYDGWGWSYTYVYPMTIYPVTVPDTTGGGVTPPDPQHGPFCGAVGTDGCNAIAANDNQFVAWATNVVLTRGPQMITNPDGPFASFGGDTNAIGPATMDNTMDAVSLGDGGSALVTFERPIRNGEGPDFAVFENSFNDSFLELAFVEVSSDGEHFVRFPATSLTPTDEQVSGAVGGVDPTMLNNLAGKFRIGYGTPFDLEELAGSENLDIDSIVYVRIIDAIGTIDPQYATYDAYGHIVNDPWPTNFHSSGYDLTGVGVIHQRPVGIEDRDVTRITVYPNPCSDRIYVNLDEIQKVELYNMNGRLLELIQPDDTHFMLDMQQYPAGMYLLKVGNGVQKIMKK